MGFNISVTEYNEILSNAGFGVWRILLKDGESPRMQVNAKMAELLGITENEMTDEEIYSSWYDRIAESAIPSVQKSVEEMLDGKFSENTYQWNHPYKGLIYVRCGGTSITLMDGTHLLRGYHADVTSIVLKDEQQKTEMERRIDIINSVAKAYNAIYYINLEDYQFEQLGVNLAGVNEVIGDSGDARASFEQMYKHLVAAEQVDEIREFTNLETVNERLKGRSWIAHQFYGPIGGWSEGIFIAANRDEDGNCDHVIWATRSIDEIKRNEEQLVRTSNTDELTGLLNRRAYEEAVREYESLEIQENFVYISIDINGLKIVNDTLGHSAGDELIVGACECMKSAFGSYGRIYRTGGDEFIAMIFAGEKQLRRIKRDIEELTEQWHGNQVDGLSVSCGYVSRREAKDMSLQEIAALADRRMYDEKQKYYRTTGVGRRNQRDAHSALCALYTKILKINLTDDTYLILDMDKAEREEKIEFPERISEWLIQFGKTGLVHPEDVDYYLESVDVEYMKKHFASGKKSLTTYYRRKLGDEFKDSVMEIVPANDYSDDYQSLFLYVRYIER